MEHKSAMNHFYKSLQARPLTHEEKMQVRNTYRRKALSDQKENAYAERTLVENLIMKGLL